MESVSTQAAQALYPTLSAFHAVQGRVLGSIREVSKEGSLEKLAFDFGSLVLAVRANEDDDTVDVSLLSSDQLVVEGDDVGREQPWTEFVGRAFGWGWLIINQQGYIDGVLFSFDGIDPQLLLNVIASSIKVSRIMRASL